MLNSSKLKKSDFALYAVSACRGPINDLVEAQVGGATFLQLREKDLSPDEFIQKGKMVREIAHVPLVINDNIDVAVLSNADGVHVGQGDEPLNEARRRLGPDKIVGVSCSTVLEAITAQRGGADYLGVGAIFSTGTKLDARSVSLNTLQAICDSVDIPVIAIGGISADNITGLAGSGIAGAAVVSALFGQGNVRKRTEAFKEKLDPVLSAPVADREGLILDLDGVLLDSLEIWQTIDREILTERGMLREDLLTGLHNISTLEAAADFLRQHGMRESEHSFIESVKSKLEDLYRHHIPLYPGTENYLRGQKESGKKIALITASPGDLVLPALRRLGVRDYFDAVFCNADKRFSNVFCSALEALGTGIKKTVVIDDSEYAQQTARQVGFQVRTSVWE